VIGAIAARLGEAWAVCAAIQLALWLVARRTRNAGVVDVGWALAFAVVALVFALGATAPPGSWLPIAMIVVVWSVRLGTYLIARGAATGPEDGRYRDLRARWARDADRRFFVFFQAQAALTAILASAFVVPFIVPAHGGLGWLRWPGALLAATGILGETCADAQLRRWKLDPDRRGRVCDAGLWGWSRHPNYFFEWCVWLGHAVYGVAFAPWGLVAIGGQAIIVASIFGVTGIPPTEAQALRSKGDAYRDYQRRVSRFVPRPQRRA